MFKNLDSITSFTKGLLIGDSNKALLQKNDDEKEQGEKFPGRLVFGHESQTFQGCGSDEIFWLSDPENLVMETYQLLTENQEPYTEVYAEVVGTLSDVGQDEDGFAADYGFKKRLIVSDVVMEPLAEHSGCAVSREGELIVVSDPVSVPVYNPETQENELLETSNNFSGIVTENEIRDVTFNLVFANAHLCGLENATFTKKTEGVYEYNHLDSVEELGGCRLGLSLSDTEITFTDPSHVCSQYLCGARGSLDAMVLAR